MKVITFTSLFPNATQKNLGGFIDRRMTCWAARHAAKWCVVAPLPYFPRLPIRSPWRVYADIKPFENYKKWPVYHPQYFMLPKIGLSMQGASMAAFSSKTIRQLIVKKGGFDLIDAHFVYPDGYAALKISQKLDLPLVVSARGSDINSYSRIDRIRSKIQQVLKNADAVIGVSKDLVEEMIALGAPEDRCHLISNGVDTERFCPCGNAAPKRVAPNLLAVGNLVPEKGVQLLLNALSLLKKEYPEIRLDVVGAGPELKKLTDICKTFQIEKNVRFLGQISHEKIHTLFQSAGLFCITSLREGNPNVVLEALATGVPVAATPVGGVPELIVEGVNGFLSKDHTPEAVAETIRRILRREWSPYQIRGTVSGRTWEHVADDVQAVFERVLKNRENA